MPPSRRSSVGTDAPAGTRDDTPGGSASRGGRGSRGLAVRGGGGGRGRGRPRSASIAAASTHGAGIDGEEGTDDDAGYSRSPSPSAADGGAKLPRTVSPELGIPQVAAAESRLGAAIPRSSSLSLLSDAGSNSPATPARVNAAPAHPDTASVAADGGDDTLFASPSSVGTARAAVTPGRAGSHLAVPASASRAGSARAVDDSLSELDTSDGDERATAGVRRAGELSDDEPFASTSTSAPLPAPALEPATAPPAPKRRGRPPGSKNKQPKAPVPRAQRAAAKADAPQRAPSTSEGSASASPAAQAAAAAGARIRATRANVTLPPGYIEGVTSSRWPRLGGRKRSGDGRDDAEEGEDKDDGARVEDVTGTTTPVESRASSIAERGGAPDGEDEKKPMAEGADRKGKSRAFDGDEDDGSVNGGDTARGASMTMSRETSLDGRSVTPVPVPTPTKGRGKGKGVVRRGKKGQAAPEPLERAKRRRLDVPDKEAETRHAAREAARNKFLDQLDLELDQVEDRSHPLLDIAYQRLRDEKAERLERLRRYQDEREKELALMLDKRMQASWRQWADQKDALRMKLYLENHNSLKELIAEEKVYPFFRDHPLFINDHDLPPTSYYRGPQRDPAFQPREVLHAGHYVEPPPHNAALKHEAWQLAPEEIEADLALFYDIEDEPFYVPPPPEPVAPPSSVGVYPYPPPTFYYDPLAPPAPGAAPYMVPPGYGPLQPIPPPGAPYALPAYGYPPAGVPGAPPLGAIVPPHLAAAQHPYGLPGYPYDPQSVPAPAPPPAAHEPARQPLAQRALQPSPPSPVQTKVSPVVQHKAPAPAATKAKAAVNGASGKGSPTLPPMQSRPPSHGPPAPTTNGHGPAHAHGHPHGHPYPSYPSQPPQNAPPSPARPRDSPAHAHYPQQQQQQQSAYPAPRTAAQRFSPSFGAPAAPGGSAQSPVLAPAAPQLAPPPAQGQGHGHGHGHGQGQGQGVQPLPPLRGTLFPSMPPAPAPGPPGSPARGGGSGVNGAAGPAAPPTLPSLSRKAHGHGHGHPASPPRGQGATGKGQAQAQGQGQGQAQAPPKFSERGLPPLAWSAASPPGGGAPLALLPAPQQQQQVGPATGLPLPSWLRPLAQQVKLPHEVRREEEERARAAQQGQGQGAVAATAQEQAQRQGRGGEAARYWS
ncbi:hypothetical protein JCM3770_006563 [Rhodotorula araucariae]